MHDDARFYLYRLYIGIYSYRVYYSLSACIPIYMIIHEASLYWPTLAHINFPGRAIISIDRLLFSYEYIRLKEIQALIWIWDN